MPKGSRLPLPRKLSLRIGEPRDYSGVPDSKEGTHRVAEDLRSAVEALDRTGTASIL
jgi:hypothetical protein